MSLKSRLTTSHQWFLGILSFGISVIILMCIPSSVSSQSGQGEDFGGPTRTPVPAFLSPPYPGIQSLSAIFDHHYPSFLYLDSFMVAPNGRQAPCEGGKEPCFYDNPPTTIRYNDHDGFDISIH